MRIENRLALAVSILVATFPSPRVHAETETLAVPLRSAREAVIQVYDVLSDTSAGEARTIYQSLPVDLRSDLWTYQLEQFLASDPRLTPEQEAIVMEAIGLLSSGVLQHQARGPTLYRAFRAAYGMTPGEYRKQVPK